MNSWSHKNEFITKFASWTLFRRRARQLSGRAVGFGAHLKRLKSGRQQDG